MSAVTDFTTAVQTSLAKVNADLDVISTGITALDAQIQALQNSPGTLTPADQSALDSISAASTALAAKADAVVPAVAPPVPAALK